MLETFNHRIDIGLHVHRATYRAMTVFAVVAFLTGCRLAPSTPLYPDDGAVLRVLDELREAAGQPDKALAIKIEPYRIAIQVQDKTSPRHIDEYSYERHASRRGRIYWDVVKG
jgi:hypothetical protein